MAVTWTLKYDGVEKSFAAWGIDSPRRRTISQGRDEFTFTLVVNFDADSPFAFEATVQVYREEGGVKVKWFEGPAMEPERTTEGGKDFLHFVIAGPWYWLENRLHLQTWKTWDNATQALVDAKKARLFLGYNAAGQKLNTKEQLIEALDWAIANGEPIQYDATTFPVANLPIMPANQVSIAQVITMVLQVTPDAVTRWDYTQTPPKLHIARRADLTPATLSVAAGQVDKLNIRARPDLQRPAVLILYSITSTVNGQALTETSVDKWPANATGLESGAVIFDINLQGPQATYQFADVQVTAINADHATKATRCAWWAGKVPWLTQSGLGDHAISDFDVVNVQRETARPNEPANSNLGPWMVDNNGDPVETGTEKISALVQFERADKTKGEKIVSVRITSTNATTRFYSTLQSLVSGEPLPTGLAKVYYDAVSVLQYQGEYSHFAQEVTGAVGLGHKLNLSGGRAVWATMAAVIWEVTEDIDRGETVLRFGPAENLAPPDLVSNLELWRSRFIFVNTRAMTGADQGQLSNVDSTDDATKDDTVPAVDRFERFVMEDAAKPYLAGGSRIDLNIKDVAQHITAAQEIKLREVDECVQAQDGSFETWKRLVVCSERYRP